MKWRNTKLLLNIFNISNFLNIIILDYVPHKETWYISRRNDPYSYIHLQEYLLQLWMNKLSPLKRPLCIQNNIKSDIYIVRQKYMLMSTVWKKCFYFFQRNFLNCLFMSSVKIEIYFLDRFHGSPWNYLTYTNTYRWNLNKDLYVKLFQSLSN